MIIVEFKLPTYYVINKLFNVIILLAVTTGTI
jgi:hypothetical protein